MAIKVKHEMNAAPAAAATLAAGRARRSMETARMFAACSGSGGRGGGTTGAQAHPISPGGIQAHVVGAHAPGVTDWEGTRKENAAQEAARLEQAVDVANLNNAAAKERTQMGIDAEKARRDAQNAFTTQRDATLHNNARQRAEQSSLLAMERDIAKARLNAPAKPESPLMSAIRSLFPSAPALPAPAETTAPQKRGTISIRPAVDGKVSMYDRVRDLFLGSGDASPVDGLKGLIDDADSVLRDALAKAKTGFGLPSNNPASNGGDTLRMLENLGGGTETPAPQPDDIAGVYASGGSVFGQSSVTGGPLDYLRPPAEDGDAGAESEEYASSIGGMIGALLRV